MISIRNSYPQMIGVEVLQHPSFSNFRARS
jgi:hypothetical protein